MRLLIMGLPGAGKGTQAVAVADRLGIPTISTGEIFRENIREQTPLGKQAQPYLDAGEYVPDEVTDAMVRDRLAKPDAHHGFLLDGYPRTLAQAETLDTILAEQGHPLERVIELVVDTEEVVKRLVRRGQEEGRSDDSEDVIRRRLQIYTEQTTPLLELYEQHGVLVRVDGEGDLEVVTERVLAAVEDLS